MADEHEDAENPLQQVQQYHPTNPHRRRTISIQSFFKSLAALTNLLKMVRNNMDDDDVVEYYDEKEVYTRLMNDLDEVEDNFPDISKIFVSFEILVFLLHIVCLVASFTVNRIIHWSPLTLPIWQWIALSFALFSGFSIIRLITFSISIPIKCYWKIQRYLVYFIHTTKRSADVTLWLGSVLFVWFIFFRPLLKYSHGDLSVFVVRQITRLLIALDLGAFLWFLKDILYLKLEADLHYRQLFERIRLTVMYFHGLRMIDHNGGWKFLVKCKKKDRNNILHRGQQKRDHHQEKNAEAEAPEGDNNKANKNIWMDVYYTKKETVPIWILRRLSEEYLYHAQQKKEMIWKPDAFVNEDALKEKAETMLKMIITDTDRNTRSDIELKDLDKYCVEDKEKEKELLFNIFGETSKHHTKEEGGEATDMNKLRIRRDHFLNWAVKAFKHCSGLERTLQSSEKVFIKLNRLLSAFVVLVVTLIWLLLSSLVNTGQLALLFSPFLAATFIFGESCKQMFEGLIFIFAMHPFDVGDRVIIDNKQMKVNNIYILTSTFYKYDSQEMVIYPNSILSTMNIVNLDITPDQGDCLDFAIPRDTPAEDLQDLQLSIKKYMNDDSLYTSNTKVVKTAIGDKNIEMAIHFKYLVSYLSAETKALRKSQILSKIMLFLDDIKKLQRRNCLAGKPVIMEFIVKTDATIEHIRRIKRDIIIRYVVDNNIKESKDCRACSKVIITEITTNENIKLALYLRKKKKQIKSDRKDKVGEVEVDDDDDDDDDDIDEGQNENITTYSDKTTTMIQEDLATLADKIIRGNSEVSN